jgi:hypothetical protein
MCNPGMFVLMFFIKLGLTVSVIALLIKALAKPERKRNQYLPYTAFRARRAGND